MEKAKEFMKKNSRMDLDEEDEVALTYSTREYGDMINERYSMKDYKHALEISNELKQLGYNTHIEGVDEWILLIITKNDN